MTISSATITFELQAVAGAVTLADSAIKKIQTQFPPGPPDDPTQQKLLSTISAMAADIQQLANSIAKDGGSAVVVVPNA